MFFILGNFFPFYFTSSPKSENFKTMKKHLEISPFYTSGPKIMIMCYAILQIRHMTHIIVVFHFGQLFFPFTPLTSPPPLQKKKKKSSIWIVNQLIDSTKSFFLWKVTTKILKYCFPKLDYWMWCLRSLQVQEEL